LKLQVVHSICENSEDKFQKVVLEVEIYFNHSKIYNTLKTSWAAYLSILRYNISADTAPAEQYCEWPIFFYNF